MIFHAIQKKRCIFAAGAHLFSASADRLHNGFLFLYLESIILNKDEERYWMIGGNTGMLTIRIFLEIYPICHGLSGTEVSGNSYGLRYRSVYSRRDGSMLTDAAFLENEYLPISFRKVLMGE